MDARKLLKQHVPQDKNGSTLLLLHSEVVAQGALAVANRVPHLEPDVQFVEEAGILHDIGIAATHAPTIGCLGTEPYLMHGVLGAEILKQFGFHRHALVCERHIGVGLTCEDILSQSLPLPPKDMLPISIEEQIICYVDNYFSKSSPSPEKPLEFEVVRKKISVFGERSLSTFDRWASQFGIL